MTKHEYSHRHSMRMPITYGADVIFNECFFNLKILACLKDGRVEGCRLNPYYRNTKITSNWTTINKNTAETYQKKTKKKPQRYGRRCVIMIKSNPITAGWATHKLENNYTTKFLPQEWKSLATHQASQPADLATGGGAPRESGFEGQRGLIRGIPQYWGK